MTAEPRIPTGWRRLKPNEQCWPQDRFLTGCANSGTPLQWALITEHLGSKSVLAKQYFSVIRRK